MKQTKLTKSARDEECTLQIHPYCNGDTETTVLCHINSMDKGIGYKSKDFFACFGCSDCHDIIDGRRRTDLSELEIKKCIMRALYRTWLRWIEKGLIEIDGFS